MGVHPIGAMRPFPEGATGRVQVNRKSKELLGCTPICVEAEASNGKLSRCSHAPVV
jgi:hypothetical protein